MAGVTAAKAFTGLTGLTVAKNPTHTLGVLYSKTLRALAKVNLSSPVTPAVFVSAFYSFFTRILHKIRLKLFYLRNLL